MESRNRKAPATLRDWRTAHGYTLQSAARALGLPMTTYWHLEQRARIPLGDTLVSVHRQTGVPLDALLPRRRAA